MYLDISPFLWRDFDEKDEKNGLKVGWLNCFLHVEGLFGEEEEGM